MEKFGGFFFFFFLKIVLTSVFAENGMVKGCKIAFF